MLLQDLYMSVDDGMTWKLVQSGVDKAVWGVPPDPEDDTPQKNPDTNTTMYFTYAQSSDDILSKHCEFVIPRHRRKDIDVGIVRPSVRLSVRLSVRPEPFLGSALADFI
ncbi:hypothetical protein DPMN_016341 [Dreissena polymorpha]|uniref:Uncharacterized protein n=1 Tax=Dreissena polymorpha TaxID=45954 RepID=A0A9D4NFG7_DREPO|nr:hypothetical protein DPMN_016341 [Dreissena polymorpha]